MNKRRYKATYHFVSLGCPKNLVDTERMLGLLAQAGFVLVTEPDEADLIIINTCGFIASAREESLGVIRESARWRRTGPCRGLIVAGCLVERDGEDLRRHVPEIDALAGVFAREHIVEICTAVLRSRRPVDDCVPPPSTQAFDDRARLRITPHHLAYLKIAEGCSRRCSFCTIPSIRGPYLSKPIEQVRAEAEELASDGVRELCVIAQDTTSYGLDLYKRPRLADLLGELATIPGLHWIRLMYAYPHHFGDDLVEVLAGVGPVVPYVDLPIQHIDDEVLRRMKRGVTRRVIETLLHRLRQAVPGLVLRTTLIAGFPGETDEQFDELLAFVRETRFERAGCFVYSNEPGTPAATLDGQVPEPVRRDRYDRLMQCQQQIALAWNASQIDRTLEVVIDGPAGPGLWAGRSYADAPEVDGLVYVEADDVPVGDFLDVQITASEGYDLKGKPARTSAATAGDTA